MTRVRARLQRLDCREEIADVILQQSDDAEKRSPLARIGGAVGLPARIAKLFLGAPEHAPRFAETLGVRKLMDGHLVNECKEHATH